MRRLNADPLASDVDAGELLRLRDQLQAEIDVINATLAAQVLIDADFDARITALEGGGGGGGVAPSTALAMAFLRC